ncbi:MAG TPA: TonB-dependent receptor [Ignavibacteria bacterium]|nr:TonB-dependent receptor [Ignavibacteria bacterium]
MKYTDYILVLLFLFLINEESYCQFSFKGKITDTYKNEPVVNAKVEIAGKDISSLSDEKGEFNFENLSDKIFVILVSRIGYKKYESELNLNDTGVKYIHIKLIQMEILSPEIEVYSTKIENQLKYSIFPIAVVPESEYKNKPAISIPEAISTEPGIELARDGIWASDIVIRGLGRDNIVVLVNGNRIETSNNLSARLSMFDLNSIERIEIIKGGTSAIYGSGGTGGVVSIYTKSGQFTKNFSMNGILSGNYSSVNEMFSTGLSVFLNSKNIYANIYSAFRKASDTKSSNGTVIPNSSFRDNGISMNAGIKFGNENNIVLDYQRFFSPYAGISGGYPLFPASAEITYKNAERQLYGITFEKNYMEGLITDLSAKLFFQNIFRDVEVIPNTITFVPASGNNPARRITNISVYPDGEHYSKGFFFQADFNTVKYNKLIGGLDFWQRKLFTSRVTTQKIDILDSNNNIVSSTLQITGDTPLPESHYSSIGIFVQDEISILRDKIFLDFSGRVDAIYVSNETVLSPAYVIKNGVINNNPSNQKVLWESLNDNDLAWSFSAGGNYKLNDNLNAAINFSGSFRSPSLEERYQYIDLGNVVRIGNPYLQPEKSFFISASLKHWSEELNISVELFSDYLSDLVAEIPGSYENRPALIKTNIGNARLTGLDAELEYNFYKSFVLYANASYAYGVNTDNEDALPLIPPFNGRIGLKCIILKNISLNFNTVMYSKQDRLAAGETSNSGYILFNLYSDLSNISFYNFSLNLSAGIENISDLLYSNHLSTNRGSVSLEPGRNIFLKIKIEL